MSLWNKLRLWQKLSLGLLAVAIVLFSILLIPWEEKVTCKIRENCYYPPEDPKYSLDYFGIALNTGGQPANETVINALRDDLNNIASSTYGISNIKIDSMYMDNIGAYIKINYIESGLTRSEMNNILHKIESFMNSRWYVSEFHYNTIGRYQ